MISWVEKEGEDGVCAKSVHGPHGLYMDTSANTTPARDTPCLPAVIVQGARGGSGGGKSNPHKV